MITNFKDYILNETLVINLEILKLTDYVFDYIKENGKVKKIKLNNNILNIEEIRLKYDTSENSYIDVTKSNSRRIYLNLSIIDKSIISHELNHALQYLLKGKEKTLNMHYKYKSLNSLSYHCF